ncbi:MAG: hypothetical protein WB791_10725 [Waddliaceae bacterium]
MNVEGNNRYSDIQHNLEILGESVEKVRSGKADQDVEMPDYGFIQIFKEDINRLRTCEFNATKIKELTDQLEKIDHQMKQFLAPKSEPLMGEKVSPKELAKDAGDENIKAGYESLQDKFAIQKIKADGHCFFRAAAAGLLYHCQNSLGNAQDAVKQLKEKVNHKLNDKNLETKMHKFEQILDEVVTGKTSVEEVMRTKDKSDALVKFLRHLACADNRINGGDSFKKEVSKSHYLSVDDYLKKMEDFKEEQYGGGEEIEALNRSLPIPIVPIYLQYEGKSKSFEEKSPDPQAIYLTFAYNHCNLAVPK